MGDYEEALTKLKINPTEKSLSWDRWAIFFMEMAKCHLHLGQRKEAISCLNIAVS